MLTSLAYALLLSSSAVDCRDDDREGDYHLTSVCETWLEGSPAYSATVRGSLMAKPASQQVFVSKLEGEWLLTISGYSWDMEAGVITTRRAEHAISEEDGETIAELLSNDTFERLGEIHYYGSEGVICTDGANYELAAGANGRKMTARQHSCAGKTEINTIMATLRQIAIKYDPDSEGMLYWLRG